MEIPLLGIEVSAQPAVLSVSGKGTIPSDHDAIGMAGSFWVGIGVATETRVVTRGNLYLAGSITVEPLGETAYSDYATVAMSGDGMVGGWGCVRRVGGVGMAAAVEGSLPVQPVAAGGRICSIQSKLRCASLKCPHPDVFHTSPLQAVVSWDPLPGQSGKYEMITQLDVIPSVTIFDKM